MLGSPPFALRLPVARFRSLNVAKPIFTGTFALPFCPMRRFLPLVLGSPYPWVLEEHGSLLLIPFEMKLICVRPDFIARFFLFPQLLKSSL